MTAERLPACDAFEGIEFHYQPIVSATTGRLVACEALARNPASADSTGELLARAIFGGGSTTFDRFALMSSLRQIEEWRRGGLFVPVHVNVTASTLAADAAQAFAVWLAGLEADTGGLTLEITESTECEDLERLSSVVEVCRAAGIEIAIDDFGCGYSTLALLQTVRADVVKIDGRFTAAVLDDARSGAIVRHVVALAHELGMRVVAEGVETERAAAWLARVGCDELQGYAFAPALQPDDVVRFAQRRRA